MSRNVYFSHAVHSEQNLYEDLVIESLKIYGHDIYYMPRHMVSRDMILNEDIESKFDEAYMIEMYLENIDGFDGDGTLFTKFGLQIRDQATFVVSKRQWEKLVGIWNNEIVEGRPNEGDLLYFPITKSLFEYSDEEITTGIEEIDALQKKFATEYFFGINNSNGTDFVIGEFVKQVLIPATLSTPEVSISGKVLRFDRLVPSDPTSQLRVALGNITTTNGEFGEFVVTSDPDQQLVGLKSGAQWNINEKYDIDSDENLTFKNNAEGAQNYDFEKDGNDIIDFTETNPFGEIGSSTPPPQFPVTSYRSDSESLFADTITLTADTQ